ncbi:MAG: MFS transporter [Chloroflexota bacterium]
MKKVFYGWWVVAGAFALLFCAVGTYFYSFPVFYEATVSDMGWSRAQTAAALSIAVFVLGGSSPLIGGLIRKTGQRPIMVGGSLLAGAGFVLLSTVEHLWQFYLYYGVVVPAGVAGIYLIPTMSAVERWFEQKRSTALGIATAGIGVGGAIMAPLASVLIEHYSWQTAFLVFAVIVVGIGVPVGGIVMRTPEEKGEKPVSAVHTDNAREPAAVIGVTLHQALRERAFWCISVGGFLWAWAYGTGIVHQVAYAVDMGIDRIAAAGAVGFLTAFSIAGRLGFGRLGDILDKRYVFMLATCLQVAAFTVLLRTTNVGMLYVYAFLIGVNVGGLAPILPGLIVDYFGRAYFGVTYGISFFVLTLGQVVGPFYGGWVFDTTGSYHIAFLTSVVLSLVAITLVYFAGKPLPRVSVSAG